MGDARHAPGRPPQRPMPLISQPFPSVLRPRFLHEGRQLRPVFRVEVGRVHASLCLRDRPPTGPGGSLLHRPAQSAAGMTEKDRVEAGAATGRLPHPASDLRYGSGASGQPRGRRGWCRHQPGRRRSAGGVPQLSVWSGHRGPPTAPCDGPGRPRPPAPPGHRPKQELPGRGRRRAAPAGEGG